MFNMLAAGGAALSLLASPVTATAGQAFTPITTTSGIVIQDVQTNGNGCPVGSATTATVAPDGTLTITFTDQFTARRGSGVSAVESRKNCMVTVVATSPAGTGFTFDSAAFAGSAALPAGSGGLQATGYNYAGNTTTTSLRHSLTGPLSGAWSTADSSADLAPVAAGACGSTGILHANPELRASTGTTATISMSSATLHLATVPC